MPRWLVTAALVGLAAVAATVGASRPSAQASRSPKDVQAVLEQLQKIPEGTMVRVRLMDGETLEAQLLDVTPTSVRLLPREGNRLSRTVAIDQIKQVQRVKHSSVGKKIAIGVAVGVLAFVGIVLATCAAVA